MSIMLQGISRARFHPALSFIGLLAFVTSFLGSRLFATLNPTVVIQQQGIHFHHFWYGIGLLAVAGWLAITWKSDRLDRVYALMYGLGAGFIGDEIGLLLTFGDYKSELTYEFLVGAIAASVLLLLLVRYRELLRRELSYLLTREGLVLLGVFVAGFSLLFVAFGVFSFATSLAVVGIVVILREILAKPNPALEGRMPRGITILAALAILGGADLVLGGIGVFLYPPTLNEPDLAGVTLSASDLQLISTIFQSLAVVAIALGSVKLVTGLVLRNGKSWAWTLGMAANISSIFLTGSQLGVSSGVITGNMIEAPTSILALVYLTRPYVKRFYRKTPLLDVSSS